MDKIEHMKHYLEMYESLQESINAAGGTGAGFVPGALEKMTALELIHLLATNDIRFKFVGHKEKKQ